MTAAVCPISVVTSFTIPAADRAALADVPLRVRVEAADPASGITARLFSVGGEITARALRYSARSNVLTLSGRADLALHSSSGVVSFQADDPRAPLRVVVEDWSGRTAPLEATGGTVVLVRTPAGVELHVVAGGEPEVARARVA